MSSADSAWASLQNATHKHGAALRGYSAEACGPETPASNDSEAAVFEVPGGSVPLSNRLRFVGGSELRTSDKLPCFRTMDIRGQDVPDAEVLINLYPCV